MKNREKKLFQLNIEIQQYRKRIEQLEKENFLLLQEVERSDVKITNLMNQSISYHFKKAKEAGIYNE